MYVSRSDSDYIFDFNHTSDHWLDSHMRSEACEEALNDNAMLIHNQQGAQ